MNLGEKILEMRTKANMSQGDLADVLKVSRQSVSKWETNSSTPELDKLLKMSEIFKISIDELVHGDKEEFGEDSKDRINNEQAPRLETRKIVGVSLLGIGTIIFILLLVLVGILPAIVLSLPFLITGLICLIVRKHTSLWSGWILYLMVYFYLTYATGIRPWWIFHLWVYQNGLTAHAVIAWIMAIALVMLIVLTYRTKLKER
ncbi:MAG: helix-turn-helix transcriptional regulator [Peptostreptococcaceae bacterium]|nr:helix-turn-helix transcriptional regulator [Peptostreptococcaceae bacterium]